jgi:hypothetical protein
VILNAFEVSARTAIQIADRVVATISNMPQNSKVDILMLTTLLCIKEKDTELFDEIVNGEFVRTQEKEGKTNYTYLDDFLENYIEKKYHYGTLNMTLRPNEITKEPHAQSFLNSRYKEGNYSFELIEYLKQIFSNHFHSTSSNSFLSMLYPDSHSNNSPEEEITSELIKLSRQSDTSSTSQASILWIKLSYIKLKYNSIDMDEYKDFIELASPLDWMGKNELEEID